MEDFEVRSVQGSVFSSSGNEFVKGVLLSQMNAAVNEEKGGHCYFVRSIEYYFYELKPDFTFNSVGAETPLEYVGLSYGTQVDSASNLIQNH